jgi:HNH endonuclease
MRKRPLEERFWEKVDKNGPVPAHRPELGPCWVWLGCIGDGYGHIGWNGKNRGAHIISYMLAHGPIEAGNCVLHACDNRRCVNPLHLSVGDKKQNAQEREERGRGNHPRGACNIFHRCPELRQGEMNGRAKITEVDAWCIRESYAGGQTADVLSEAYDLTKTTVWHILHGKLWKNAGGSLVPSTGRPFGDRHHMRRPELRPKGEKNVRAKLTDELVRQIRADHAAGIGDYLLLGSKYGVHPSSIGRIILRKAWTHVE